MRPFYLSELPVCRGRLAVKLLLHLGTTILLTRHSARSLSKSTPAIRRLTTSLICEFKFSSFVNDIECQLGGIKSDMHCREEIRIDVCPERGGGFSEIKSLK